MAIFSRLNLQKFRHTIFYVLDSLVNHSAKLVNGRDSRIEKNEAISSSPYAKSLSIIVLNMSY